MPLPAVRDASHEVSGAEGLLCRTSRGSSGSPRFAPAPVSMRASTKSRSSRSPEQIAQVHSLVLEILFRVPSLSLPPAPFRVRALLPGSRPSSRSDRVRPLMSRVPKSSIRSVRRCSQPLDGFLRAPAPRACFIPQPRPGCFARSGASLLRAAIVSSSERSAPLPLLDSCSAGRILTATADDLGFEALIRSGARTPRGR